VLGYLGTVWLRSSFENFGRSLYLIFYKKLEIEVLHVIWFECYVDCI
jgi:hypothetical protein